MHRIYQNKDNLLWPNIYSLEKNNNKIKTIRKDIDKKFVYYLAVENEKLCMYSPSPCTSYEISKEIKYTKKAYYSFLEIK
jgi:hypothetical protein